MEVIDKSEIKRNRQLLKEEKKKKKIAKDGSQKCDQSKSKNQQQPKAQQQQPTTVTSQPQANDEQSKQTVSNQNMVQQTKTLPQQKQQPQTKSQTQQLPSQSQSHQDPAVGKTFLIRKQKMDIFAHIPRKEQNIGNLTKDLAFSSNMIHPSVIKIGLRMNQSLITGSTQRCVAMLIAFKDLISSYSTPCHKDFSRGLESALDTCVKFLDRCRPLAVSMRNAIAYINLNLSKIASGEDEAKARQNLIKLIDKFINVEIEFAIKAIQKDGASKIDDNNEVLLTYGNSLLVRHIIHKAYLDGKRFRVIVVDSRPWLSGKKMIKFLIDRNIQVTYTHINAIAYVMKEVTKVLIGAHALLANGYVMAGIGSSQIALVAKAYNVPVLVCCETYKFSERVHTDSFVLNESGPIDDFYKSGSGESCKLHAFLSNEEEKFRNRLNILNLFYDITPSHLVSLVITEKGFLPCSSVPAVIRKNIDKFHLDL